VFHQYITIKLTKSLVFTRSRNFNQASVSEIIISFSLIRNPEKKSLEDGLNSFCCRSLDTCTEEIIY